MAAIILQQQPMTFDLELARDEAVKLPALNPMQGDQNAPFQFRVVRSSVPVDLTGTTVTFKGSDADGVPKVDSQPASGNRQGTGYTIFNFNYQDFKAAGNFKQAFFVITKGDEVVATIEISINVRENQVDIASGNQAFASEYQKQLQTYIDHVTDLSGEVDKVQAALKNVSFYTQADADQRFLSKLSGQDQQQVDSPVAFTSDVNVKGLNVADNLNRLVTGQATTGWHTDGVTMLNGLQAVPNCDPRYVVQRIGTMYLVLFSGIITNMTIAHPTAKIPVVKFPDSIPFNSTANIGLGYFQRYATQPTDYLTWQYDDANRTLLLTNFDETSMTATTDLIISVAYLCQGVE